MTKQGPHGKTPAAEKTPRMRPTHGASHAAVSGAQKTAPPALEASDLKKEYHIGGVTVSALRGVDLRVERGDFIAITGASGSGKSTLLGLIGCLDRPTSGTVRVDGIDANSLSDDGLARMRGRNIGFVFQSFNLQSNLTAWENVALPMRIHEFPEDAVEATVGPLLEKVGVGNRLDHYPNELSGGQQQRVAIARALSTNPTILLADEPTGNLDSESGIKVLELLSGLNRDNGVTTIIVTHEPTVLKYARRNVHIKDGRIDDGVK